MVDVFNEGLLGGDENLPAIGAFYDKESIHGTFVDIDKFS